MPPGCCITHQKPPPPSPSQPRSPARNPRPTSPPPPLSPQAEAFRIDVPDFEVMAEMEADVMATKAHWDRYADFLRERDEMANRDWLSMRDQVGTGRRGGVGGLGGGGVRHLARVFVSVWVAGGGERVLGGAPTCFVASTVGHVLDDAQLLMDGARAPLCLHTRVHARSLPCMHDQRHMRMPAAGRPPAPRAPRTLDSLTATSTLFAVCAAWLLLSPLVICPPATGLED